MSDENGRGSVNAQDLLRAVARLDCSHRCTIVATKSFRLEQMRHHDFRSSGRARRIEREFDVRFRHVALW
jgi:hypothetical protein